VWTAIACDFLAIMASSVSSEQGFSSAALTITKCHNHLKGDVIVALQVMKCLLHCDLVFCESGPSSLTEDPADDEDKVLDGGADELSEESVEIVQN
ncbi:uncharacterized protein EDB91DRAFT_1048334, partial [Suillus paluster]|uniref:uncharacterized protein n=1 Tax=Suillus paluster TaxID=48578 RepID=UPI001B87BCDF